jgi:hypothetical protein
MPLDYAHQKIRNNVRLRGFWPGFCAGCLAAGLLAGFLLLLLR